MTRTKILLLLAVLGIALQGCSSGGSVETRITGKESYSAHTSIKSAVLRVEMPDGETSSLSTRIYGSVYPANTPMGFAHLVAHYAREPGNMTVVPPPEAKESLEDAGLDPNLRPTPSQLQQFMTELGCEGYFECDVIAWDYSYFLLYQHARIEFVLSFHLPDRSQPVWKAQVSHSAGGESDREVASTALRTLFERLRGKE